jgi:hypothetical protein
VCGTKNLVSVRLYSAPQSHWTIVVILRICAYGAPVQAGISCPRKWIDAASGTKPGRRGLHLMPSLQEPHTAASVNKLPIADFENMSLVYSTVTMREEAALKCRFCWTPRYWPR